MTRYTWPAPGQDESNIAGSRLADQMHNRFGGAFDGYNYDTAKDAALAEMIAVASDTFDVRSFGARGDGISDDTVAIQEAINAALQFDGSVYFAPGTYLFTRLYFFYDATLNPGAPQGATWEGKITLEGPNMVGRDELNLGDLQGAVLRSTATTGRSLNFGDGAASLIRCTMRNLGVLGTQAGELVYVHNANIMFLMDRVYVENRGSGTAIWLEDFFTSRLQDVDVWGDNSQSEGSKIGTGIYWSGGTSSGGLRTFTNVTASHFATGWQLGDDVETNTVGHTDVFIAVQARRCQRGFDVQGLTNASWVSPWAEHNTEFDLSFSKGARRHFLSGGVFSSTSTDVTGNVVLGSSGATAADNEYGEIVFTACDFRFCYVAGIRKFAGANDGAVTVENCKFNNNGGFGIQIDNAFQVGGLYVKNNEWTNSWPNDQSRLGYLVTTTKTNGWRYANHGPEITREHITADLDLSAADTVPRELVVDTSSSGITVDLPTSPKDGQRITIIKRFDANTLTVDAGSNSIKYRSNTSVSTITLTNQFAAVELMWVRGGFWVDLLESVVREPTEDAVTLADEATPSVKGGRLFVSGGTTTITDFDDGIVGQEIVMLAAHSVTITHNASIILLAGATNFAMAAGDTLTLRMFTDQVWHEVGRSDNT